MLVGGAVVVGDVGVSDVTVGRWVVQTSPGKPKMTGKDWRVTKCFFKY